MKRQELTKRLDKLCQTYARYHGAKKVGGEWWGRCVSCGRKVMCKKANGGHFIPRGCLPLKWDTKNVHCQCVNCNLYHNGAYLEYSQWFIKNYGQELFNQYVNTYRKWRGGKIPTMKIDELRLLYNTWLDRGRELEKEVGPLFPKSWKKEPISE